MFHHSFQSLDSYLSNEWWTSLIVPKAAEKFDDKVLKLNFQKLKIHVQSWFELKYRYRISKSMLLLNLAVIKYTDKNKQDAILNLYNVISILKYFFHIWLQHQNKLWCRRNLQGVLTQDEVVFDQGKLKGTIQHGLVKMFAETWFDRNHLPGLEFLTSH